MAYSTLENTYRIFHEGRIYGKKSIGIQPAFKFMVEFENLDKLKSFAAKDIKEIFPVYVKNVKLPLYSFKKEVLQFGPFDIPFPIFEGSGLELSIEFLEDSDGFVSAFLYDLQKSIFSQGRHNIGNKFTIYIHTFDEYKEKICTYKFYNCFYLKAENISFDYEAVTPVTYNVTFVSSKYDLKVKDSIRPYISPSHTVQKYEQGLTPTYSEGGYSTTPKVTPMYSNNKRK